MEAASEYRSWDELIPDALGLIFGKVSVQERVTVIPRVCKSWAKVVSGPNCWQEINLLEWRNRSKPHQLDRMVETLIARSCGSLRKLCVSGLQSDSIFNFIAENARCLETLRIPKSNMSDSIMEQIAGRLSMISFLDVSYCVKMSARGLEVIGKNCKLLERLCRNMKPWDTGGIPLQDDEAIAIASTMPNLKFLEMTCHVITTEGVRQILCGCPKLEFLNLAGCWDYWIGDFIRKLKPPKMRVLGPHALDYYDGNGIPWEAMQMECAELLEELDEWPFINVGHV